MGYIKIGRAAFAALSPMELLGVLVAFVDVPSTSPLFVLVAVLLAFT